MATDDLNKLNKDIETLEGIDPESSKLKTLKAKRDALLAKSTPSAPGDDAFELDMSEEEFATVATGFSSRPVPGDYPAEIGYPDKDYSETAMKIPFTIIADGPWKGYEDAFYPGKSKGAAFSIKNICESAGIAPQVNPKTNKVFFPITQLAGKRIMATYKLKVTPGTWIGNDGVERENTPQSKVAHAKPYYEKPQTII